jgi:exodeoxyribonuclease VII small subunit
MTKEKAPDYQQAFAELEQIVRDIERETIGVDELAEKVKRAAVLIAVCRQKLKDTEVDVQQILDEINKQV